jgi:hypothetical protein
LQADNCLNSIQKITAKVFVFVYKPTTQELIPVYWLCSSGERKHGIKHHHSKRSVSKSLSRITFMITHVNTIDTKRRKIKTEAKGNVCSAMNNNPQTSATNNTPRMANEIQVINVFS